MLQRIGLIAIPSVLIAVVAVVAWRADLDSQSRRLPSLKPQERPGATAWGGLSWGASAAEVMALYPNSTDGRFVSSLEIAGTQMDAVMTFESDHLVSIDLGANGCTSFTHLVELLSERYGAPVRGDAKSRIWQGKTSWVTLECTAGRLSLVYEDRTVADLRIRAIQAEEASKAKDQARGL